MAETFPRPDALTNWKFSQSLLPHARVCVVWVEQWSLHTFQAASLLQNASVYLATRAQYREAEQYGEQALAIYRELLGEQDLGTAAILNNLAGVYFEQSKLAEAEAMYSQALAIYRAILGEQHPSTADVLNNLARVYRKQGKLSEAETIYQQALTTSRAVLGEQHPDTATFLDNLGLAYHKQGKLGGRGRSSPGAVYPSYVLGEQHSIV